MKKIILILLTMAWFTSVVAAQDQQRLEIDISGMECKFCAHNIKKSLSKLDGVKEVSVDLDKGVATIIMAPGKQANVEQLRKQITQAGFTPGDVRMIQDAQ
ncbi:MAG: hypothetical protein GC149_19775 [Gammaproteobacteria bacterium]|nr:hypothetical protein [Gammaproteobacteria bacterium]